MPLKLLREEEEHTCSSVIESFVGISHLVFTNPYELSTVFTTDL